MQRKSKSPRKPQVPSASVSPQPIAPRPAVGLLAEYPWLPPVGVALWGALLAAWLTRAFFVLPLDQNYDNHESYSYQVRLVEFLDCLSHGFWSPQWCVHLRGGLGSPLYGYYQPGFFYVASVPGTLLHPTRAVGLTVLLFAGLGYWGAYRCVRLRWGTLSGWLAGTALLLSPYTATNILVRGDLSEFAAMMLLPVALAALVSWFDLARVRWLIVLAIAEAGIVVSHPAVALAGYPCLAVAAICLPRRAWLTSVAGAGAALAAGVGLSAFYWAPVFFEWNYVSGSKAFEGVHHFSQSFVPFVEFWTAYGVHEAPQLSLSLGAAIVALLAVNLAGVASNWRRQSAAHWRWLLLFVGLSLVTLWLMTSSSRWVWEHVGLLGRMQFPWRLFSVSTTTLVFAAAAWPEWPWPRVRAGAATMLVLGLLLCATNYLRLPKAVPISLASSAAELVNVFYAPDRAHEWVPNGAALVLGRGNQQPSAFGQGAVDSFRRVQGHLSCQVRADGATSIVLPHYYFPVGWQATLVGDPIPLSANRQGLMRIDLPPGSTGLLELRFHMTPWRRRGWYVTALSAVALAISAVVAQRLDLEKHLTA